MDTPHRVTHLKKIQQISTPVKIPPSPFMKNLGYGTGVNVYRLDRSPKCGQSRSPWAVKRISQQIRNNGNAELFNSRIHEEAEILRKLSHPNIVGFRGTIKSSDGVETLALECCSTSLGSILEDRHDGDLGALPSEYIRRMIIDIARALDYLHKEAMLLHGDLKSYNVLVKGNFEVCKLCDFGVSLPMDENGLVDFHKNRHLRYVGTNLWSAPEVMDELEVIDSKADIFSFGLIIYETISLVPPHTLTLDSTHNIENKNLGTERSITGTDNTPINDDCSIDSDEIEFNCVEQACGTRPPLPQAFELTDDYNQIIEIFYYCTNELAEDRPAAKAIWTALVNEKTAEEEK